MLFEELQAYLQAEKLFLLQKSKDSLVLLVRRDSFYRLYYQTNLLEDVQSFAVDQAVVQELIYRGPKFYPQEEVQVWKEVGFQIHMGRDNYFLNSKGMISSDLKASEDLSGIKPIVNEAELHKADAMIRTNLDLYTGDILSSQELRAFSVNGDLFGIYVENELAGVVRGDYKNRVYWLGHMVVDKAYRGQRLSSKLLKAYLLKGLSLNCRQFQLWVLQNNEPALALYKKYGFKYLNKSTISLLKK
ncbi:GNAT family N-acetyltransferase [Akkermansiaceae bacterium]|nr:GNAT family N-acetyltransferase [Akkermansiaceae bacterium]